MSDEKLDPVEYASRVLQKHVKWVEDLEDGILPPNYGENLIKYLMERVKTLEEDNTKLRKQIEKARYCEVCGNYAFHCNYCSKTPKLEELFGAN